MAQTIIEKILSKHAGRQVSAGDVTWIEIEKRTARDFGGASVVRNLKKYYHPPYVDDVSRTFFTFDCNVPARDTGYADNQQICRDFAEETGVRVFDTAAGIGSHVAMERGLALPGEIFVGTDSHLNIMGAVNCFGQGMGDRDIAYIWARGRNWFEVPGTMRVVLENSAEFPVTAKDITLAVIRELGSAGALGKVIEFSGPGAESLSLAGRITVASMATEMGAIAAMIPLNERIVEYISKRSGVVPEEVTADPGADYERTVTVDLAGLEPLAACPFSPSNVKTVSEIEGRRIHTAVLASCTNGRFEDMVQAASILQGRRIKEGITLKVVPATFEVYSRMLEEGILRIFSEAGAIVSNPGCGGCASGQIGMVGKGEIQLSTSNRNFAGKQGSGETYLVSPATAAASVIAGEIASPAADAEMIDFVPDESFEDPPKLSIISWSRERKDDGEKVRSREDAGTGERPGADGIIRGRARLITGKDGELLDDIDTDMIFHNRYLSITDPEKMGRYTFETLERYGDFAESVRENDIIIAGGNFGCGSSRQHAVDCFMALGAGMIITRSTGAIYKRNIINSGFPFLEAPGLTAEDLEEGEELEINFIEGTVTRSNGEVISAEKPPSVQVDIYRAGGLFAYSGEEG